MGTKNIHPSNGKLTLDGKDYELDYSLASFAYLSEKYGDLGVIFKMADTTGKDTKDLMSREFLEVIANMVYAGIMRPDAELLEQGKSFKEADTSGLNPSKILLKMKLGDVMNISKAISGAMIGSMPDADPTKAGTNPAK